MGHKATKGDCCHFLETCLQTSIYITRFLNCCCNSWVIYDVKQTKAGSGCPPHASPPPPFFHKLSKGSWGEKDIFLHFHQLLQTHELSLCLRSCNHLVSIGMLQSMKNALRHNHFFWQKKNRKKKTFPIYILAAHNFKVRKVMTDRP